LKAARVRDDGSVAVVDAPVPAVGPGDALMRTLAAGICGSDLLPWYVRRKAGTILGHEVAGEIVEVGAGVSGFAPGDRVVPHHHAACGFCVECLAGRAVHCASWRASFLDPGGMAELVRIPAENLSRDTLPIPSSLSAEEATFVEPLATVVKAFRRGRFGPSRSFLAVGLGTTGQLALRLARAAGASRLGAADPVASRRRAAESSGATELFDVSREPLARAVRSPFDFVFVGPGKGDVLEGAFEAVAPGGTLLAFTMAPPDDRLSLPFHDLYFREIEVVPSYSAGPEDMRESLAHLVDRRVRVADLVTHRFPLDRAGEAFARAAQPEGSMKVVLTFE
jgi:L-iditol 2-dehydrogenase